MALSGLSRVFDGGDSYGASQYVDDCQRRCVCCVVQPHMRSEKFCACMPVTPDHPDPCCLGSVQGMQLKSPDEIASHRLVVFIQITLTVQIVFLGLVGLGMLFLPRQVVFRVMVNDAYAHHFQDERRQELLEKQQYLEAVKSGEDHSDAGISWNSFVSRGLSKLLGDPTTPPDERAAILEELKRVELRQAERKPEELAMTTPTQMLGGAFVFMAVLSIADRVTMIDVRKFPVFTHLVWYLCMLIAMGLSSVTGGEGLASSFFASVCLVACAAGFTVWMYVERKLMRFRGIDLIDDPLKPYGSPDSSL